MPTELNPTTESTAEAVLRDIRAGRSVYVEGAVGSGRTALLNQLRSAAPEMCILELLPLGEVDAPGVALLEARASLGLDAGILQGGGEGGYFEAASRLAARAADQGGLVVRLPSAWTQIAEGTPTAEAHLRNARAVLSGLTKKEARIAVIADAAVTASEIGFHAQHRHVLPPHRVAVRDLESVAWGGYRSAFEALAAAAPRAEQASPLEWRLAVGLVALKRPIETVAAQLGTRPSLIPLAKALVGLIARSPALARAAGRFATIRRPIARQSLVDIVMPPDEHVPLFTECLAYGDATTRVSTPIRELLRRRFFGHESTHARLVEHYRALDGATSAPTADLFTARAWCEKVHHLGAGGEQTASEWAQQELATPEQFWERARYFSRARRYAEAADIYRKCTERFDDDDYAWHYMGWNLQRAHGARGDVERALRNAISLDPENPWWNSRLITFLISDGQPAAARREWQGAIDRTDPDGERVAASPWLAEHMHKWVALEWLRAGRTAWAREVIEAIPAETLKRSRARLRQLAQEARTTNEQTRWFRFLATVERKCGVSTSMGDSIRSTWNALRTAGGAALPLPVAGKTADEEHFQFCWRFSGLLLEVDLTADAHLEWFARDAAGTTEASETPESEISARLTYWLGRVASGE